MTLSIAWLALLLLAFVVVTALEWVSMDLAAVCLMLLLVVSGILTPAEAFEGFANEAVVAIAGLYVLNAGVQKTGVIAWLGGRLASVAARRPRRALALLLGVAGVLSLFLSNVATTALLLPAVVAIARRARVSASRYFLPLAYASLAGGMGTLVGATANLIVHGGMLQAGTRPFGFFEYALVGVPVLVLALGYLTTLGWRLVPARRPVDHFILDHLKGYLVELRVPEESRLKGKTLSEVEVLRTAGATLLAMRRGRSRIAAPRPEQLLEAGDRLIVRAAAADVPALTSSGDLQTVHDAKVEEHDLETGEVHLFEALVPPRSRFAGETARSLKLRSRFGVTLLALLRHGWGVRRRPKEIEIAIGDELLLQGPEPQVREMEERGDLLVLNRVESERVHARRGTLSVCVLFGVVAAAAAGVLPLSVAALAGAVVFVAARVLTMEEALEAIDLHVLVVVAAVLPFGHALEHSGADALLEKGLSWIGEGFGPWAVLAALFLAASLLTQFVQKAAVALCLPLAFGAAHATGGSPEPYLMAVAIAGSSAFLTPLAHPVNLIVSAPGEFRFSDYARVGLVLQLLTTAATLLLIPFFWRLGPA